MGKRLEIHKKQKFNLLTVLFEVDQKKSRRFFQCSCDCGSICVVRIDQLVRGVAKSCGCYNKIRHLEATKTHGKSKTKLYRVWHGMKQRCFNKNSGAYKYYGARGISVCEEWIEFEGFLEWANISGYKPGLTIERIDYNGNYCPDNCCWIPKERQSANTRRSRMITYNGNTMCMADWAKKFGITYTTIVDRIKKGLPLEEVFTHNHLKSEATNTKIRFIG